MGKKEDKEKSVERFYAPFKALMDEPFEYAPELRHVKLPYNVSYGLIYDDRNSVLFTGLTRRREKDVPLQRAHH